MMNEKMHEQRNRLPWIDTAKGIGIAMVILGHLFRYGSVPFKLIFACHMPLFFFLSGLFFKPGKPFMEFLTHKAKSLLLPYGVFFCIGGIITFMIPQLRSAFSVQNLIRDIYLLNANCVNVGQIWFLPCLFFVEVCCWCIVRAVKENRRGFFAALLIVAEFAIIANQTKGIFPFGRYPFMFDTVFMALFFYGIGYLFQGQLLTIHEACCKKINAERIVLGILLYCLLLRNDTVNIAIPAYGDSFSYLFFALLGIAIVISISVKIGVDGFVGRFIQGVGQNSLIIFSIHSFFLMAWCFFLRKSGLESTAGICNVGVLNSLLGGGLTYIVLGAGVPVIQNVLSHKKNPQEKV